MNLFGTIAGNDDKKTSTGLFGSNKQDNNLFGSTGNGLLGLSKPDVSKTGEASNLTGVFQKSTEGAKTSIFEINTNQTSGGLFQNKPLENTTNNFNFGASSTNQTTTNLLNNSSNPLQSNTNAFNLGSSSITSGSLFNANKSDNSSNLFNSKTEDTNTQNKLNLGSSTTSTNLFGNKTDGKIQDSKSNLFSANTSAPTSFNFGFKTNESTVNNLETLNSNNNLIDKSKSNVEKTDTTKLSFGLSAQPTKEITLSDQPNNLFIAKPELSALDKDQVLKSQEPKSNILGTGLFGSSTDKPNSSLSGNLFGAKSTTENEKKENSSQSFGTGLFPNNTEKPNLPSTGISIGLKPLQPENEKKEESRVTFGLGGEPKKEDVKLPVESKTTKEEVSISQKYSLLKGLSIEEKLKKIEENEKELLLRKSIEDIINRWKTEMDKQVDKFNNLCNSLSKFEEYFQQNFDNLIQINDILQSFDYESNQTLNKLKCISQEEDCLLNQLDALEGILDGYLNYAEENNKQTNIVQNNTENIYKLEEDINKYVNSINDQVNDLEERIKKSNLAENDLKDKITKLSIESNTEEINNELNVFYNSLQNLKYLQTKIGIEIKEAESRINSLDK